MSAVSGMQKLIFTVAEHNRQLGFANRQGTVHEVKGDKMRVKLGEMADGKPFLSPWLHTADQRGGARERRFYKVGQNVMMSAPGADLRQAEVQAYAENDKYKAPDHANESGQDEETYQLEDLRVKKTKDGYDLWLEAPKQQNQQGQQQQGQGGPQASQQAAGGGSSSGSARMKLRLNNDGGITGRIGTEMRWQVHKEGVKLKNSMTNDFAFIDIKGNLKCSKPWEITKKDPIPDDDK